MSLFSSETVKMYAESLGLPNLSDEEAAKHMRHARRIKLTTEDVNMVLSVRNEEQIYGCDPSEIPIFRYVPQSGIYYLKDKEIDFDSLLTAPLPKLPCPIKLSCHWLAIEGVQPQIPENPLIPHSPASQLVTSPSQPTNTSITKEENTKVPLVKHHLSKEHQLYFETITTCLLSKDQSVVNTALTSLRTDAGIQQLLPYFIQFISEMVMRSLRLLDTLRLLLKATEAVFSNPNFFIEPYLHQVMPTTLTLVIGKRLSEFPTDDHWSLRNDAAALAISICKKYGDAYAELQPRVLKTLLKAIIDSQKTLPCKYGAIVALSLLGMDTIEAFLLPNVSVLHEYIQSTSEPEIDKEKTEHVLIVAIGKLLHAKISVDSLSNRATFYDKEKDIFTFLQEKYYSIWECFGDKLLPFLGVNSDAMSL